MRNRIIYFGLLAVVVWTACKSDDSNTENTTTVEPEPNNAPAAMGYRLLKSYPHDTAAFTQGLVWYNQQLMEGTGQLEESNIRRVDLATGKVLQQKDNAKEIFGEGITIFNNKLYQISWKNGKAFVYDAKTFKPLQEFPLNTEGWGLTHNGKELIMSDGSSNLYFMDPDTFKEIRRVGVYDQLGPKANINELEYIDGFVYANIWQTNYIIKIDPESGKIVAVADFSDLRSKAGIAEYTASEHGPDVLNGIAYDSVGKRIFITGKYWPKLFEIQFEN
ncbi:MAG TPA: glutaminyl-peptide cyclotransferase [Phnomibacter sp.]|nr:glutaminyl-peptide cyclotransferase [Phnomibacter sp.]